GILYPLQPFWPSEIIFLMGGLYGLIGLFVVFFFEDRNKTEIQYLSMPIPRRAVVRARYLLGAILIAAGGAVTTAVSLLASLFSEGADLGEILTMEAAAVFVLIYALGLSFYVGFYHRFGLGRATILFVFVSAVLTIPVALGMKSAGTPLSILGCIHDLRLSLGMPVFLIAAAGFVVVAIALSLRLSQRFYARREF
ncbi:MAG: ABC-2 transporter permease, partial [Candidatus Aminicenantes bacterium]|nr:ABC-2 transporter permease [Candidatus Aminicenantes bacterium]